MRKRKGIKYSKIFSHNRKNISLILCGFLLTTSFSVAMIGTSLNTEPTTNEFNSSEHSFELGNRLRYSFDFLEPTMGEMELQGSYFTKVTTKGCTLIGDSAGSPALPVKFVKILLPPGKSVQSLSIICDQVEIEMEGIDLTDKPVFPYQNPIPIGSKPGNGLEMNKNIYDSFTLYPSLIVKEQNIGYCRGYSILTIALHPIQYNPGEGKLTYHPQIIVDIDLEDSGYTNQFFRENSEDEEWVKSLVYNPELTSTYKNERFNMFNYPGGLCDPSDHFDYVIITTEYNGLDYWETSDSIPYNWNSLIEKHTIDDGLDCTLVTIQDIDACPDYFNEDMLFNDTIAHIREFCKDAYEDWGTDYIFIGGDDEWIPARHMDYEHEENVDSDIYWNHLDFTFNDDQDNYWGEEGDTGFDLYAEMYIGRIPCDTPQDVSNWMTKSFYYTDNVDIDYLDNAAFYGGDMGWNCEGDDFIDYAAIKGTSDWLGPIPGAHGPYPSWLGFQYGFETWNAINPETKFDLSVKWTAEPPNPGGWMGGNTSSAVNGFKNAVNNDQVTIISAIAHADPCMSMDVQCDEWEDLYHNTKPFFINDMGCHCGDMDDADDGVLHSMLFHSDTELAFACVYNTCFGWGSFDDTNSSSTLQMKLFWDYLFDTTNNSLSTMNWQLGKAMAWSKDNMAPTIDWTYTGAPGSWRAIIQGCLLFGDPAQTLKPPMMPEHNIGVSDIDVQSHVLPEDLVNVEAIIVNNGKHDEYNVQVSFRVNDVEFDSTVLTFFESQTSQNVNFQWTPTEIDAYLVAINVTTPGVIEDFYHDNEKSERVIAGPDVAIDSLTAPRYAATDTTNSIEGTIINLGMTDETIDVYLKVDDTIEDSQSIYLTSGTSTDITFDWIPSEPGTYPLSVYLEISGEEPYIENNQMSNDVTVFMAKGSILLVDDDEEKTYESYYENALLTSEYLYDIWDRNVLESPTSEEMLMYDAVIWFTGDDFWETISDEDQENLIEYLDNGGSLFATGQHIGYDVGDSDFYGDYLHANYLEDNTDIYTLLGIPDDPISDSLIIRINDGDGANNQGYPNGISPISPATTILTYQDSTYEGGIKCFNYVYKVVYFSFGFEAINSMNDRTDVMSQVLGWLLADLPVPEIEIDIKGGLGIQAIISNNGTEDAEEVAIELQVTGGILGLINKTITDTVDIAAGESKAVSTGIMFGLGSLEIFISADEEQKTAQGKQILIFSMINNNGV